MRKLTPTIASVRYVLEQENRGITLAARSGTAAPDPSHSGQGREPEARSEGRPGAITHHHVPEHFRI
jgi:hypothetical protein